MKTIKKYFQIIILGLCFNCLFSERPKAELEDLTISVLDGKRQMLEGYGAGLDPREVSNYKYDMIDVNIRNEINTILWKEMDLTYVNLYISLDSFDGTLVSDSIILHQGMLIKNMLNDALKINHDLTLILIPDVQRYSDENRRRMILSALPNLVANLVSMFQNTLEIQINSVSLLDEPERNQFIQPSELAYYTVILRKKLDSLKLANVNIISPLIAYSSDANDYYFHPILNYKEIFDAINIFGINSNGTEGMSYKTEDLIRPYIINGNKKYWSLKNIDYHYENWCDAFCAASLLAKFLSDINHLASVVCFGYAYHGVNLYDDNWDFNRPGVF